MMYDRDNYLSSADYKKACKIPEGCTKLRGASYTKAEVFDEGSYFATMFGIKQGMATTLYSYDTPICDFCADVLLLDIRAFGYSKTTCRHLSEFLRKYTHIDYTTLKTEFSRHDYTLGEIIEIDGSTIMFI